MFTGADVVIPVLNRWRPYRIEVHDRVSLRGLGGWASRHSVRSLVVSHERLDELLAQLLPRALPLRAVADRSNRSLVGHFDTVVCTTGWAGEEFDRLGTTNLRRVPLGVDLDLFSPRHAQSALRAALGDPDDGLLIVASRLSREKQPRLALDTVRELRRRGRRVGLLVAGDGPLRQSLQRRAADLPVYFLGFVQERAALAALLATVDVALAPGSVETFGLAALEALASGTPVVANASSALPEVLGEAGLACRGRAGDFADGVEHLLDQPAASRRERARRRAERFDWDVTIRGFLAAHELGAPRSRTARRVGVRA